MTKMSFFQLRWTCILLKSVVLGINLSKKCNSIHVNHLKAQDLEVCQKLNLYASQKAF